MAEENKKGKFKLDVKAQAPEFRANIEDLKNKADYGNRQSDTTIVNSDGANASVRLTDNKVNIASSQDTGMKVNNQQQNFQSFEEKHVTNRFNLDTYEIVINGHKLNPNLWEYADMSEYKDSYQTKHAVGGLCMFGSVLCPSWDEQLHKYVLIRRLARMPIFSSKLNVPEIMKQLNIQDPTKVAYEYGYKQSTESADSYQKKAAEKLKTEEDKKDGDAPEQGSNGRHLSEEDIKQTMDKNKGMTREQAVEKLQKDSKYTRPWKEGEGYTDGKGHGELGTETAEAGDSSSNSSSGSVDVNTQVTDLYDGDAKNGEKGPNGRKYFENDIAYLVNNNKDMTREQAIDILSKDPKYTRKWVLGSGYIEDEKKSESKSSDDSDSSTSTSADNVAKSPQGKPYVKDEDVAWQVGVLGQAFTHIDDNFKNQVIKAMVSQAATYGTHYAAKHVLQAREAVKRQPQTDANKEYSQWLNDIAYFFNQVDYQANGSSSSSSIPSGSASAQTQTKKEEPKKTEQKAKQPEQKQPSPEQIKKEKLGKLKREYSEKAIAHMQVLVNVVTDGIKKSQALGDTTILSNYRRGLLAEIAADQQNPMRVHAPYDEDKMRQGQKNVFEAYGMQTENNAWKQDYDAYVAAAKQL